MYKNTRQRQRDILVTLFEKGKTITAKQARTKYDIQSLSARIFEVRNINRVPVQTTRKRVNGEVQTVYFLA